MHCTGLGKAMLAFLPQAQQDQFLAGSEFRAFTPHTITDPMMLRREASARAIHRVGEIDVYRFAPAFLDAVEAEVDRLTKLELVRTDGRLYVTVGGQVIEGELERVSLVEG